MKLLKGKDCSNKIKEELKLQMNTLDKKLKLVVIRVGDDEASKIYVKNKYKSCIDVGYDFEEITYRNDVSDEVLIDKINELNLSDEVTGILVQLPLPKTLDTHKIINTIDYKKDVDGLTTLNIGKLNNNESCIVPCTASGIIDLFDFYGIDLEGKNITVVNRSNLIGKPLIPLLLNRNATVSVCHSKTKNLIDYTRNADIIIVGVGIPNFINSNMIKDDSIIIDVGINRVDGKIMGDVNFTDVENKVSMISPVPGGVGVLTVTNVIKNVYKCYELLKKK